MALYPAAVPLGRIPPHGLDRRKGRRVRAGSRAALGQEDAGTLALAQALSVGILEVGEDAEDVDGVVVAVGEDVDLAREVLS